MDRTARRLGVVVACVLVAAGCGDDGGSGETGFGSGEQFSITGALSQIPREFAADLEGNIEIYVADLLAAGEATGQSRPTGSSDADEATEWLGPMTGRSEAPVFVPVPFALLDGVGRSLGEYKDEVGFTVTDVDATIESRALPLSMMVLAGALEPAGTTEVADGVLTIGDGGDFEIDLLNATSARNLGRPIRIASDDGLFRLSTSTDAASAWLDPGSERLDSDQAFAVAAEILDQRDVIGAALLRNDFSAAGFLATLGEDGADPVTFPITTPFDTVAVGWGVDDGDAAITVVYVTADEPAAAAASVEIEDAFLSGFSLQARQPIADLVIVDDVATDGRSVVVSLRLPSDHQQPITVLQMIVSRDVPFIYDP